MRYQCFLKIVTVCCLVSSNLLAQTAENPYYPVILVPNTSDTIALVDTIDSRTPLAFERMIADNPGVREVLLQSGGGSVTSGLAIASRVHALQLKTTIPSGSGCYSACSFIFFAGHQRQAFGELGVHQISYGGGDGSLIDGQYAIADILDVLNRFDVHPNIFSIMFRTPPEDMFVFSTEENRLYGFLEDTPRLRKTTEYAGRSDDSRSPLILEPVATARESSWFVVAGSYPQSDLERARAREKELRNSGVGVTLIDTSDYTNFSNGLFAVVVGPTTKEVAELNLDKVKPHVADAYIKAGLQ